MIDIISIGSALIKPILIILIGGGLIGLFYLIAIKNTKKDNEIRIILEQMITGKRVYVGEEKGYIKIRDNIEKKVEMLYIPKFDKWYTVPNHKFLRHDKKGTLVLQAVYDGVGGFFWVEPSSDIYSESLETVEEIAKDENGNDIFEEVIATDDKGNPINIDKDGNPIPSKVPKIIENKKKLKRISHRDVLIESDVQSFFIEKGFEIHKTFENRDKWSNLRTAMVVGAVIFMCLFAAVWTSKYMVDKTQETTFFIKGELDKLPDQHANNLIKKLDELQKKDKQQAPENPEKVDVDGNT